MKKSNPSKPEKATIGYPVVEKLIETEDFSKINQTMSAAYDKLDVMRRDKKGGMKRQKDVRAAMKAYDLTIDLIRDLLKVKYDMIKKSAGEKSPKQKNDK